MKIKNNNYKKRHNNSGDNMIKLTKNRIIYIYLLLFMFISYFSIYKAKDYTSSALGELYNKQIIWYLLGFFLMYLISKANIKKILNIAIPFYIIINVLLLLLLKYGVNINSTKAWFNLGFVNIQPSELMKVSLILMNAKIIDNFYNNNTKIKQKKEFKLIITLFIVTLIPSILTFLEPDTGAVICYFVITISMLFISGINKKWFIYLFIFFSVTIGIIFYIYYNNENLFINLFGSSLFYRIERIINWNSKIGMQLNNSLISIGSSGLFGHYSVPIYYPESTTDFVFTSFSSSSGLITTIIFLTIIMSFDIFIINQIKNIKILKYKYLVFGITSLIIYGQIQNIAMTIGLLPIIGITLPFISYGGSSIITYLLLMGIIINILNQKKKT